MCICTCRGMCMCMHPTTLDPSAKRTTQISKGLPRTHAAPHSAARHEPTHTSRHGQVVGDTIKIGKGGGEEKKSIFASFRYVNLIHHRTCATARFAWTARLLHDPAMGVMRCLPSFDHSRALGSWTTSADPGKLPLLNGDCLVESGYLSGSSTHFCHDYYASCRIVNRL